MKSRIQNIRHHKSIIISSNVDQSQHWYGFLKELYKAIQISTPKQYSHNLWNVESPLKPHLWYSRKSLWKLLSLDQQGEAREEDEGFSEFAQRRGLEELQTNVKKELNSENQRLHIAITRVEKRDGQPNILAEYIALQLKNRVSFRKLMKKAIELTEQTDTKGIQVQIVEHS